VTRLQRRGNYRTQAAGLLADDDGRFPRGRRVGFLCKEQGEDETRPVIDRVEAFLHKNTKRCRVIDSEDYSLPGVPASVRGHISPLLLSTLSKRLAEHYQAVTGHSLKDRRYMFKTTY
jgi:fructoselysine-6-P-deglycase FrlB-like protein